MYAMMIDLKIKQIQHEVETWKRMLLYMQEENIHLKNRLSEVLKDRFDKKMLEVVEVFQSKFITQDDLMNSLKKEVAAIEETIYSKTISSRNVTNLSEKRIAAIRNNLEVAEKMFAGIKTDFNHYLSENINDWYDK